MPPADDARLDHGRDERGAGRRRRRPRRARSRLRGAASDDVLGVARPVAGRLSRPRARPRATHALHGRSARRPVAGMGCSPCGASAPIPTVAKIAEELRTHSAHVARIDGAIAGTPFFIALVPGYLTYLQQEMRMTLRTAALYGRDPRELRTSAEMLALRGVHPDVEAAEAALISVRDKGLPDRPRTAAIVAHVGSQRLPAARLRRLHVPVGRRRRQGTRGRVRAAFGVLLGVGIWVTTWVLPLTFMIVMAWGCETHARQLGRRTLLYYDGEADNVLEAIKAADQRSDRGHDKRAILRAVALFLSVAIPIGFIGYAQHIRHTVGVNWLGALGALVALSLVIATAVISSRK